MYRRDPNPPFLIGCRRLSSLEKAYSHIHHKCETSSCVNPRHLIALSPEAHHAIHATKDKMLKEQIYRGEWEKIQAAKAERERLERLEQEEDERQRLEAIRLERERLERERLQRQREEERLKEIERQRIVAFDAENRRVASLCRERRKAALRKFCVFGVLALGFGLPGYLEITYQWFPKDNPSVGYALAALAPLAVLFLGLAVELKNPFPGVKVPRWQLDEIAKHRRLRRKTDPTKIVWTRTSERVAVTEFQKHWARVAARANGKFDFFVYSKDSGQICFSLYNYDTEQKAMHAAVDFMRDGKQPGLNRMPKGDEYEDDCLQF